MCDLWHPYSCLPIRHCCCCLCDPEITCYVIGTIEIVHNVFGGIINFGVGDLLVYVATIVNILLHLFAGILLIIGTLWGRRDFKIAYCWLSFTMLFTILGGIVAYAFTYKKDYLIWRTPFGSGPGAIYVAATSLWLIVWNVYTPMVVAGNLDSECL